MPIFEFECDTCNKTFEQIISFEESEKPRKCGCGKGNLEKKNAFNFNFSLKGDWFKTTGKY